MVLRQIAVAIAAVALSLSPAHADTSALEDPDDVAHSWDIRAVNHGHETTNKAFASAYQVRFYEPFGDPGGPGWEMELRIVFEKTTRRPDRRVVLEWEGNPEVERPLHGYIYNRAGEFLGYAKVSHGSGGVTVGVPERLYPKAGTTHWVRVVTKYGEVDRTARLRARL